MKTSAALAALVVSVAGIGWLKRREITKLMGVNDQTLALPNVQAFLKMIRVGEGTSDSLGYYRLFGYRGGAQFTDVSDHPRRLVTRGGLTSSAAGAYQILRGTWDGLVRIYGFSDFGPHNQDLAAVALIKGRHALDDVIAGRFAAAIDKCNREWASLPGSPYGQPTVKLADAQANFVRYGGTVLA